MPVPLILKNAARESFLLKRMSKLWTEYLEVVSRIDCAYKNSTVRKIKKVFTGRVKTYSAARVLSNAASIEKNVLKIDDSMLINYMIRTCAWIKKCISEYAAGSRVVMMVRTAKDDIYYDAIKSIGFIMLIAGITNIIIITSLSREVHLLGWFMRIGFIIIGITLMSCKADFNEAKKTSIWCSLLKEKLG